MVDLGFHITFNLLFFTIKWFFKFLIYQGIYKYSKVILRKQSVGFRISRKSQTLRRTAINKFRCNRNRRQLEQVHGPRYPPWLRNTWPHSERCLPVSGQSGWSRARSALMCRPGECDVSGWSTVTGIMCAVPRKPRRTHWATANRTHELFIYLYTGCTNSAITSNNSYVY